MNKKDVLELKRRFKKDACTFTRLCGCYVDGQKSQKLHINETFLNLADEEFYKYLEIAKKTLSGTVGNNLLELSFLQEEEGGNTKQQFLLGLRESKLKNEDLLERLYELIIEKYEYAGNYLILVFHDAYDVITKTTDNSKLDESEEVYEYLLCAICPVELTKAGLGYREDINRIGSRIRDWIVLPPETGFLFPAFTERSSDIHSLLYFTKNVKEPRCEFMLETLGCEPTRTATEEKTAFEAILQQAVGDEGEHAHNILMDLQETMNMMVEEHKNVFEKEPMLLNSNTIQNIIADSGVSEEIAEKIEKYCEEEFGDTPPIVENLIDPKALALNAQKKKEQNLQKEVIELKQKLNESKSTTPDSESIEESTKESTKESTEESIEESIEYTEIKQGIILNIQPQKVSEIKSQFIDGKKYIIIPVDEDEQTTINGQQAEI